MTFGVSAMARMTSSVKAAGWGLVNRTPLETLDLATGLQQLAEGEAVAELDAVGVDVLPQQRDLHDALSHERLNLGEDLAGRRSCSLPRRLGTMQNVQVLLQPTEIETQPL